MISKDLLHREACRVHAAAENNHLLNGYAAPLLVAIPAAGPNSLILLPQGLAPQPVLEQIARETGAVALVFTSEAWVSLPGLSPEAIGALPFEDLPRPERDPNRIEAIITTAVGLGPDRLPTVLTRRSRIQRTETGTSIGPAVDGAFGIYRDRADEVLAGALTWA
ncbi:MAG TPA: hypothetical protein VL551_34135 [Actinospica sp.]|nr:hypothetical protein [Actinospica sp.]